MKKIGIALVLIALAAGIGAPFFSGLMMERIIKQSVEDINQRYVKAGSDMTLEVVGYNRRFSSSEIEWKINLGALRAFYGIDEVVFTDRAEHGFLSVSSITSLEKNKWYADLVNNKLGGINPLNIQTRYEVFGNIKSTLSLDAFSVADGKDVLDILPGQISIQVDKKLQNASSLGTWKGMTVPGKFKMDNLSLNSKTNKVSAFIWQGDFTVLADYLWVNDRQKEIELSKLKCDYKVDFDKEENLLSIGMGYGIDRLKFQQAEISDAFVQFGINNIDAQGYEDFIKTYSQMVSHIMNDLAGSSPDDVKEMMAVQMGKLAPQLLGASEKFLKKGFEIYISDLRAKLPQGEIKGDLSLSLIKDMTIAQFIPIVIQPGAALDIFSLKSDILLPHGLVGDNQMLLAPVYPGMQTGLFLKNNGNLIHKAQTLEGKLFLNGQEVLLN